MESTMFASEVFNFKMYNNTSLSYTDYRNLVDKLVLKSKTTGSDQTENRIHFTKLNVERMNRLDKTIRIEKEQTDFLENVHQLNWIVISEAWCGDCAQILPVLNKMTEVSNGKINLRIVLRDENPELMDLFLTNNTRSVPKLIILSPSGMEIINTWGPRPAPATKIARNWNNNIDKQSWNDYQKELHLWYSKDKGQTTIKEIIDVLK